MPSYNDEIFSPPAPVVSVKLRSPESGATREEILLLIDSGADVTLLPKSAVDSLGIVTFATYELIGFDGTRSTAAAVRADLLLLNKTFRGQFLVAHQEVGILGRDILNSVSLLLDGPRLMWEERMSLGQSR